MFIKSFYQIKVYNKDLYEIRIKDEDNYCFLQIIPKYKIILGYLCCFYSLRFSHAKKIKILV